MNQFPTDLKKIKTRIRSYEKSLQGRADFIDDSYGKRYLLGPMYLLAGDIEGALASFTWFEKKFPDDIGEPAQYLCWTLALLKNNSIEMANEKLWETMFRNLYLIPFLLGENFTMYNMRYGSNWEWPEYAKATSKDLVQLWSEKDKSWARETFYSEKFVAGREKYIQLSEKLKNTEGPTARRQVMQEISTATKY